MKYKQEVWKVSLDQADSYSLTGFIEIVTIAYYNLFWLNLYLSYCFDVINMYFFFTGKIITQNRTETLRTECPDRIVECILVIELGKYYIAWQVWF